MVTQESLLLEVGWAWDDVSMGRALHMIYDLRWTQVHTTYPTPPQPAAYCAYHISTYPLLSCLSRYSGAADGYVPPRPVEWAAR